MLFLKNISIKINALNEWIGKRISYLTAILVVVVVFDVTMRYIFSDTKVWIMELEWHLFALIFLLGAGYALKHDKHVRVDLFYANFSKEDKALVNFIGSLVFLIPWVVMVIYFSFGYSVQSFRILEESPDPGGLPARYLIKFAIPFGMFLLLLQAIALTIDSFLILAEKKNKTKK